MTSLQRSRRLQAGLAGLGVLSALGAAVGLGLTTHTRGSTQSGNAGTSDGGSAVTSPRGDDEREGSGGAAASSRRSSQASPVTPPSSAAPQATTSGS
jgi:hypothetical protein